MPYYSPDLREDDPGGSPMQPDPCPKSKTGRHVWEKLHPEDPAGGRRRLVACRHCSRIAEHLGRKEMRRYLPGELDAIAAFQDATADPDADTDDEARHYLDSTRRELERLELPGDLDLSRYRWRTPGGQRCLAEIGMVVYYAPDGTTELHLYGINPGAKLRLFVEEDEFRRVGP